jgi:hypothetical protein
MTARDLDEIAAREPLPNDLAILGYASPQPLHVRLTVAERDALVEMARRARTWRMPKPAPAWDITCACGAKWRGKHARSALASGIIEIYHQGPGRNTPECAVTFREGFQR